MIISYLDGPSALSIAQSCKMYRSITKVESPKEVEGKLAYLVAM
jgi:hypothetical protein